MAKQMKGMRRIVVEGIPFAWRIRPRPTYMQEIFESPMTFSVRHAEAAGAVLVVSTPYSRPDAKLYTEKAVVTPAYVAECVKQALDAGWVPTRAGKPVLMQAERLE